MTHPAILRRLCVLVAALMLLLSTGCKQEQEEKTEEAPAAQASAASVEPGTAAAPEPVGSADEQKQLLEQGPGAIDTTTALRMMGSERPQRVVLRPAPLQSSGLAEAILGALPPAFKGMYDEALSEVGGIDPLQAVDSFLFWSDSESLDDDKLTSIYAVVVTQGDALSKAAANADDLFDGDDDDDKPADEPVATGFIAAGGALDAATRDKIIAKMLEESTEERPVVREDLGKSNVLMARPHKRQGTTFVYFWPEGLALGHSNAEGESLDVAREAAAKFVREVEAARAGSGGELPETTLLDVHVMPKPGQRADATVSIDEALVAELAVARGLVGDDSDKAIMGFEQIAKMSGDDLRGFLGSQGVPAPLQDVAVVVLDTLEFEAGEEMLTFKLSPSVEAIKGSLPKGQ